MILVQQQDSTEGYGGQHDHWQLLGTSWGPKLRVFHYCKSYDKIMMVCRLYDSNSPNATLIGIEYMIVPIHIIHYKTEKPNGHFHKEICTE